ncbi:hypothetical protein NKR19_g10348, partial [Coniochaeta hoffmannii]
HHPSSSSSSSPNSFGRNPSVPSLDPSNPLGRRRKEAPEGPERQHSSSTTTTNQKSRKGKQKTTTKTAHESRGVDPLEIAYGPIVGTNPDITEDDFEVDLEEGTHRPQADAVHEPRTVSPEPKLGLPPREGEEEEDDDDEEGGDNDKPSPTFSIGSDEDEFRNVWDK